MLKLNPNVILQDVKTYINNTTLLKKIIQGSIQKYDPFVLVCQVQQVYFTPYPSINSNKNAWWAVFKVKARPTIDALVNDMAF